MPVTMKRDRLTGDDCDQSHDEPGDKTDNHRDNGQVNEVRQVLVNRQDDFLSIDFHAARPAC